MPVNKYLTIGFLLLLTGVFLPALYRGYSNHPSWSFVLSKITPIPSTKDALPVYVEDFVQIEELTRSVHSPAVVELGNGNLLAVWYGGTREGAKDVMLYQSLWNRKKGVWGDVSLLTGPKQTQADLHIYIKKVGNPVLLRDASGKIWLFYVTVSVGGWSGSAINYRTSIDNGNHWGKANRLITTPFLNISTLVRGAPFLYSDGSIGLPVYHELLGKFGELLRIGSGGSVLDKVRISWGRTSLQPSVVPLDHMQAVVFLRYSGHSPKRILQADTLDGGQTWSTPEKLPLLNPDSSIMGLRLHDGTLLLVFNNSEHDRDNLSLARSLDSGHTWNVVHVFEDGHTPEGRIRPEFSYPSLIQDDDGTIHLLYTWNRRRIKHIYFNPSWLRKL